MNEPAADADKLDSLSKQAALTAVESAVVLAALCLAIGVARSPAGARPRGTAAILSRTAGAVGTVFGFTGIGLSMYFLGVAAAFTAV